MRACLGKMTISFFVLPRRVVSFRVLVPPRSTCTQHEDGPRPMAPPRLSGAPRSAHGVHGMCFRMCLVVRRELRYGALPEGRHTLQVMQCSPDRAHHVGTCPETPCASARQASEEENCTHLSSLGRAGAVFRRMHARKSTFTIFWRPADPYSPRSIDFPLVIDLDRW